MFEVEKKFNLGPGQRESLIQGASLVGQQTIVDEYYDFADFSLTINGHWLRRRDGQFELTIMVKKPGFAAGDYKEEIGEEPEVMRRLGLSGDSLAEALAAAGCSAFCRYTTRRQKYGRGDFVIDFDEAVYSDGRRYLIAEIELVVGSKKQMKTAMARIRSLAAGHGLDFKDVPTKLEFFLQENNPRHYQALVDAGIFSGPC